METKITELWQTRWKKNNFAEATPIQRELFSLLATEENVIGISPTGSGKTLAYLLPLLEKLTVGEGPQLLILLPSQELAMQVNQVAEEWASDLSLQVLPIIGGANPRRQIESLKSKPEVIVGTAGRVLEMIKQRKIRAHFIQTVVLDEVDQLLSTSEFNATQEILKATQKSRQLVCVSATATAIEEKVRQAVFTPFKTIDVTEEDQSGGEVEHLYLVVANRRRTETLRGLAYLANFRGMVFFNQLQEMGTVSDKLLYEGVPNATLASDQNKMERRLAVEGFRAEKVPLLLTTDLAARGLDFEQLPFVVHYEVPVDSETYLHRSGRTGRMGAKGTVLSLVNQTNLSLLEEIAREQNLKLTEVFLHGGALHTEKPTATRGKKQKKVSRRRKNKR